MSIAVTAKIRCEHKEPAQEGYVTVRFSPDYQDGRNQEWAAATPSLSLIMTLKDAVADHFEPGMKYTLTFERADDAE